MSYRCGFIAIVGRPNVGKSTLLNQILGQKIAIISDKPQTTRNKILGVKHLPEGQMIFLDTPGIDYARRGQSRLNARLVQTTLKALHEVDLILFVVGPAWEREDQMILDSLKKASAPKILALNKIDLLAKTELISILDAISKKGDETQSGFSDLIPISAKTGENTQRLLDVAQSYLPEGSPYFPEDQVTDQPVRFLASEIIREKVIERTQAELPYIVSVQIDAFQEDEAGGLIRIRATLFVEKDSQKGILIGQSGKKLKEIGQAARYELEGLLATKVFLETWVKVKKDWRKNGAFLDEMGYSV